MDLKKVGGNAQQGQDRFRLVISDGAHYMQAMLATQLNHIVEQGQVRDE